MVLDKALELEPPVATAPVPAHTKPTLSKFMINEEGTITIVDWEWATLAPPEWDLALAVWRLASRIGEDASAAFPERIRGRAPREPVSALGGLSRRHDDARGGRGP